MQSLKVITESEVEAIHHATLRVLSEVGVVMTHPEGRDILTGAGATVQADRVLIPPDLVEKMLALCPDHVTVRGRGGTTITLGDGALHWHNLGGARDVLDTRTHERRAATLSDIHESALLLDALDQVTAVTPLYTPQDIPGHLMSLAMYRHSMPYTTKPLQGPGVAAAKEVQFVVRLAEVLGPPRETLTLSVSPVSPLGFPEHVVESIIEVARQGIPFGPLPCPTAGSTAPLSMAGALTQQNAENLAAIVLAELVHPGLPIIYCGRLAMMEPRTASSVWGGVELGVVSAATVQIGHRYHLPVNVYGLSTNSYVPDIQNGYERALNALLPALAGADELSGVGEFGAGIISSSSQLVVDNEIAGSVARAVRGFVVDDESLAVEVIGSVMNGPRNFLGERHTIKYLRAGEIYQTRLAERRTWAEWERTGEGNLERVEAEIHRLLAEHHVPPLEPAQEKALDEIMQEADRVLAVH